MRREKVIPILKWGLYYFILLIVYSWQTTPNLFEVFNIKPVLILPLVVAISMNERVIESAFFGMITGFLWDISSDKLFGFNAIILFTIATTISLICIYYLQNKLINFLFFCILALFVQGGLDYFFYYKIWQYENSEIIFNNIIFPTIIYTIIISPIFFILIRKISVYFIEKCKN